MVEVWKKIPDWPYEASSLGRIRKLGGRPVSPRIKQYYTVHMTDSGRNKNMTVHRLVCLAFHGNPPTTKHVVAHWDDDGLNNNAANLRWATSQENYRDMLRNGLVSSAFKNHRRGKKLTETAIQDIRECFAAGRSAKELSQVFKTGLKNIYKIIHRKTWKDVLPLEEQCKSY